MIERLSEKFFKLKFDENKVQDISMNIRVSTIITEKILSQPALSKILNLPSIVDKIN